jgi:hypothetical protein
MPDTADRLFEIFRHPDFLAMKGLANEAPIYIHAYDPAAEDETRHMVERLASRLRADGVALALVDLFDLILEHLEQERRLQRIVDTEAAMGKPKLLALMNNLSDARSRLIPWLLPHISGDQVRLTLLTGAGRVFPFLRTHTVLEAVQPAMTRHPIVMFFPGEYVRDDNGSRLILFGSQPSPKLYRPYYRANNLADYHP